MSPRFPARDVYPGARVGRVARMAQEGRCGNISFTLRSTRTGAIDAHRLA
jgi:hypothetical protein